MISKIFLFFLIALNSTGIYSMQEGAGSEEGMQEDVDLEYENRKKLFFKDIRTVFGNLRDFDLRTKNALNNLADSVFREVIPSIKKAFNFLYVGVSENVAFLDGNKFDEFKAVIKKYMNVLGPNVSAFDASFKHEEYKKYSLINDLSDEDARCRVFNALGLDQNNRSHVSAFCGLCSFLVNKNFETPIAIFKEFIKFVKGVEEPKISDKIRIRFIFLGFIDALELVDSNRALLFKDSSGFPLLPDPDRQGRVIVIPGKIINIEKILDAEAKYGPAITEGLEAITKMRADLFEASASGANISNAALMEAVPGFNMNFSSRGDVSNFLYNLNFPLSNESRIKLHEKFQEWFSGSNNKVVSFLLFIECIETIMNVNLMNLMLKDITKYTS